MNAKDAEDGILRVFCNLLLNTCLPSMGFVPAAAVPGVRYLIFGLFTIAGKPVN